MTAPVSATRPEAAARLDAARRTAERGAPLLAGAGWGRRRNGPGPRLALPGAFAFTDPQRGSDPVRLAGALPRGWGVVWRHFGAANRLAEGEALAAAARQRGLVLLVSADPGLAARIGANGVHWPSARLPRARRTHSPARKPWVETASVHTPAQWRRALLYGADAVFASPLAPGRSASPSAQGRAPLGVEALQRMRPMPAYGLGGVTPALAQAIAAGGSGFAAVEAVARAFGVPLRRA